MIAMIQIMSFSEQIHEIFSSSFTNSLGLIVILGLLAHYLFSRMKLPGLLGMLLLGVVLGPFGLNLINGLLLDASADLRLIALIVILLRAGIGLNKEDLKAIGKSALLLSFIPGVFEGIAIMLLSMQILGFTWVQGGMLGFIIAAVSPAVVVPAMLTFMESGLGKSKRIPTMILAGASIDDVVAITIFSAFLGFAGGEQVHLGYQLLNIPLAILLGIGVGAVIGFAMVWLFKKYHIRDTKKILILLGAAIALTAIEKGLKSHIEVAGLVGVMTIGFVLLEKLPVASKRLAERLNKIWIFAEILLFVLVGAQVNIPIGIAAGSAGVVLVGCGLFFRSLGVWIALLRTPLLTKEKGFCMIAYLPKATVQAAIGAIPLSAGIAGGELILAIAVLSIVMTAPLGAIGIQWAAPRWLTLEK